MGRSVAARPLLVAAATTAALALAALGNLTDLPGLSFGGSFRAEVEAVDGQAALAESFPAGEAATTDVLVRTERAPAAEEALRAAPPVASVRRGEESDDRALTLLAVTLTSDPFSDEAAAGVTTLRRAARSADPAALVGGPTAEEADTRAAASRDASLIVPLTLLAILAILVALLRALVAPVYVVASVVLSFAATLGLALLAFRYVFDAPGSDAGLPTLVFLFTVALGVDYNIFLMARVREEARARGSRAGVVVGLERTGAVITSAGLILAGTFLVLTLLPLEQLFQLGLAVALGVLVDTFVVRSLLVPAVALLLGDRSWWPARLDR